MELLLGLLLVASLGIGFVWMKVIVGLEYESRLAEMPATIITATRYYAEDWSGKMRGFFGGHARAALVSLAIGAALASVCCGIEAGMAFICGVAVTYQVGQMCGHFEFASGVEITYLATRAVSEQSVIGLITGRARDTGMLLKGYGLLFPVLILEMTDDGHTVMLKLAAYVVGILATTWLCTSTDKNRLRKYVLHYFLLYSATLAVVITITCLSATEVWTVPRLALVPLGVETASILISLVLALLEDRRGHASKLDESWSNMAGLVVMCGLIITSFIFGGALYGIGMTLFEITAGLVGILLVEQSRDRIVAIVRALSRGRNPLSYDLALFEQE